MQAFFVCEKIFFPLGGSADDNCGLASLDKPADRYPSKMSGFQTLYIICLEWEKS